MRIARRSGYQCVLALNARLRADGWDAPVPREYDSAWTFYFKAKGGYFIEVATETKLDQRPPAA